MGESALFMSLWCRRGYMNVSQHVGIWLKKFNGSYFRVRADELPVRDEGVITESGVSNKLLYIVRDIDEEDEEEARFANTEAEEPATPVRFLF